MKSSYLDIFEFDDAVSRIDFILVQKWLTETYWSPGIGFDEVKRGAINSTIVVGCYLGLTQVGYMRLVSDKTRFGYIMDVYVSESFRKKGIAQNMVEFAINNPELSDVYIYVSPFLLDSGEQRFLKRTVLLKSLEQAFQK